MSLVQSLNGQLPDRVLAPIKGGRLEKHAAAAWNAMNVEARHHGLELLPEGPAGSYRTIAQQKVLYDEYLHGGALAAKPGTSNHGWGLAVDLATKDMRALLDKIGERFGWAKKWSDAQTEWWHILYQAGHWSGDDVGPDGIIEPVAVDTVIINTKEGPAKFIEDRHGGIWKHEGVKWVSLGNPTAGG